MDNDKRTGKQASAAGNSIEAEAGANRKEKRKGESPVPDNLKGYLNSEQLRALHQIENFGWQLKFVRRPMFQKVVAIVVSGEGDKLGILEDDGRINLESDFDVRIEPGEEASSEPVKDRKQGN